MLGLENLQLARLRRVTTAQTILLIKLVRIGLNCIYEKSESFFLHHWDGLEMFHESLQHKIDTQVSLFKIRHYTVKKQETKKCLQKISSKKENI